MTTRELKRAIRRHMTTARQHARIAADLQDGVPDPDHNIPDDIYYAWRDMVDRCDACHSWWKNA